MNTGIKPLKAKHYIFILIFFLLVICILVNLYPEYFGELTEFPFVANVWGTFSDVIILIITSFTLYFLYHNFKVQNTALEYQKTEIEAIRQSLRPNIEIQFEKKRNISFGNDPTPEIKKYNLILIVRNSDIFNLSINELKNEKCKYDSLNLSGNYVTDKEFKMEIEFGDMLSLEITFKDSLGTPYIKTLSLYEDGNYDETPITGLKS